MPQQLGVFWPRQLTADRRDCIDSLRDDVMVFGRLVLEDKVLVENDVSAHVLENLRNALIRR